ncbi:MAG: FtsX-like permease family protein [Nocardioidaceae bacterium]|nr:FtsX-like permease family protein [Nocardioidaceae bacterium]
MRRVTWANLLARKVRLLLSAAAIVLGVAFVAGSFVFTDTISKSFDSIVEGTIPDLTVRLDGSQDGGGFVVDDRTIPASLVTRLAALPDVARADGNVEGQGLFVLDPDGKLIGGQGAPTLALNYNDAPSTTGEPTVTIGRGREPRGADEVVLDARTVEGSGFRLGDTVEMVTAGSTPRISARLVGIADFAGGGLAGATLVLFDTPTAQRIFLGGADVYDSVAVTARDGVSQARLAADVGPELGDDLQAVTGDELAAETQSFIDTALGFLGTFLLIFAGIALVVGTFLIVNTFSILVAQRSRELALLRAMGASRRQVVGSVLTEALVVGLLGSTVGLLLGFGLAALLRLVFGQFGLDLSGTPLVFEPRTAVVAYAVGVLVTMVAAVVPARRASRVPPVAAMRDEVALPESSIRLRLVLAVVLALAGAGLMALGLAGSGTTGASLVGGGILGVLLAAALGAPVIGRPVVAGLGWVFRRTAGTVGVLATQNAQRNPRRTAATASALMIGLALVTTMSVLGASINTSIDVGVKKEFTSDYLVTSPTFSDFSTTLAQQVRDTDGVGEVTQMQSLPVEVDGDDVFSTAIDSASFTAVYDLTMVSGTIDVEKGEVAISQDDARDADLSVGDDVTLGFPGGEQDARVVGVYEQSNVVGGAVLPFTTLAAAQIPRSDSAVAVNAAPGADRAQVGERLDRIVADLPTVTVQDQTEFIDAQRAQVNQLLLLIYALLGLAVVIAVLGIVNTLALSVIERTREVGLLRAVGLSRRQLRRMVRLEAVTIAVLGATLGVVMGLLFGTVLQRAFVNDGITDLSFPWGRLVLFVVVSAVVGVLAAAVPARRAARLDVLRAISTE